MTDHQAADYDDAQPDLRRPVGRPPRDKQNADGVINLRVTLARKNAYARAARPGKLSEWVTRHLDRAAGYEPPGE